MKIFTIAFSLLTCFVGFSQTSYDFSQILPPLEAKINAVLPSHFGKYQAKNGESFYEFDATGVWIVTTIFSSIAKETIRESSKYTVRNGYIFGVALEDSLPCELENDRYHFGMRNKEQIIGTDSPNGLKKISANSYLLCFYENGAYIPSLFSFSGKTLTVQYFDYESETTLFDSIADKKSKQKNGMNYITLTPSGKEWEELIKKSLFNSALEYVKTA
jgi:hypothetical protein